MPSDESAAAIIDLRGGPNTGFRAKADPDGRLRPMLTLVGRAPGGYARVTPTNTIVLHRRRVSTTDPKPVYDLLKRAMDVIVATTVFVAAMPALAVGVIAVKLTSPGPVFFSQDRVGRNGKTFKILKLRSMFIDADHRQQRAFNEAELKGDLGDLEDFQLKSDPRITPVGAFLRKTSIDELPQLLNVMRGEMSLVGPRPSVDWEVELYDQRFRQRSDVLPGITGLWQVEGRRTIDMIGMLELDVEYVERRSLALDLKILARTLPAVLSGTGAG